MSFQIHALLAEMFTPLFAMSDSELKNARARKMIVDTKPGYPCRVSLADAGIGETVILVNFEHQGAESPYKSSHAIFVRENAEQAKPEVGTIPEVLRSRLISVRAFNDQDLMVDADVVDGSELGEALPAMLQNSKISYLHLHNAKPGCFAALVTRVGSRSPSVHSI